MDLQPGHLIKCGVIMHASVASNKSTERSAARLHIADGALHSLSMLSLFCPKPLKSGVYTGHGWTSPVTPCEVGSEVGFSDADGATDADGRQRAGVDQATYRLGAKAEMLGDVRDRQQPWQAAGLGLCGLMMIVLELWRCPARGRIEGRVVGVSRPPGSRAQTSPSQARIGQGG